MMYVRSSGNRPATTTPRPVFASSLGRLRRRRWPLLGCWRPPPFDDELLERREEEEEEEEEKETEAREVRKRGRCCCCFQGVVWARVAVVVAVKIISLYIPNSFLCVCVVSVFFLVCFWWTFCKRFFLLFFIYFFLVKTHTHNTHTVRIDRHTHTRAHTKKRNSTTTNSF